MKDETARTSSLTGGYYWFPSPDIGPVTWRVLTCHELGCDADVGHVDLWTQVIDRLATAWRRDGRSLRGHLKLNYTGLPRGRVTRLRHRSMIFHGEDSPVAVWVPLVVRGFDLDRHRVDVHFDEHERMIGEDRRRVGEIFGLSLGRGDYEERPMISDSATNLVYVSDLLECRHKKPAERLRGILGEHGIPLRIIRGTRDVWCRDFMPIQVAPGRFVRFRYAPDYLRGYGHLITAPSDIEPIPEIESCEDSEIVLDGGNVVRRGSRCIVTDKVFRENTALERDDLLRRLRDSLRVDEIIVIPKEPYDVVGHADGVVRFLGDRLVVVNDYSGAAPWYRKRLISILRRAGLDWAEIPYRPQEARGSEIPSAFGCYANFLMVGGLVVVPAYGLPEDDPACRIIERLAGGARVVALDCGGLARQGGVLNCVTWTISVP